MAQTAEACTAPSGTGRTGGEGAAGFQLLVEAARVRDDVGSLFGGTVPDGVFEYLGGVSRPPSRPT